jgi:hypothetical protein
LEDPHTDNGKDKNKEKGGKTTEKMERKEGKS